MKRALAVLVLVCLMAFSTAVVAQEVVTTEPPVVWSNFWNVELVDLGVDPWGVTALGGFTANVNTADFSVVFGFDNLRTPLVFGLDLVAKNEFDIGVPLELYGRFDTTLDLTTASFETFGLDGFLFGGELEFDAFTFYFDSAIGYDGFLTIPNLTIGIKHGDIP